MLNSFFHFHQSLLLQKLYWDSKSNTGMSQKQVMPKSEDLSRPLEINAIWTFDTEFPTIFNKSCTYITFKSAVKHRQLGYGYPRGQTVHLAEATTQDTYFSI